MIDSSKKTLFNKEKELRVCNISQLHKNVKQKTLDRKIYYMFHLHKKMQQRARLARTEAVGIVVIRGWRELVNRRGLEVLQCL